MDNAHIAALQAKHATLDQRLHSEELRPLPDTSLIANLKKQKLRVKDEIATT
jgi:hypothetical protein